MLAGVADFDRDGHPDLALFNPLTRRAAREMHPQSRLQLSVTAGNSCA
jgi:hypothetical protein